MGAGAVGCYFGGMLARAGHHVTLVARPQHVEAIERDGLRMQTKTFDEHVRLKARTDAAAVAGADLVPPEGTQEEADLMQMLEVMFILGYADSTPI